MNLKEYLKPTAFESALIDIFIKVIPQLISFLIMLYVYLWIYDKYGIDRTIISLLIILILSQGRGKK